jgi:uracil-DNA glycosylase
MIIMENLNKEWKRIFEAEMSKTYFKELLDFLEREYAERQVFPEKEKIFNAFNLTPYEKVKVVIIGQDPYHDDGQAHGLAFSVRPGVKKPPSLRNIFKELADDAGCSIPAHGSLVHWAEQGVLLLNTVLTVRAHEPNSHSGKGWEKFTDSVIQNLNSSKEGVIFVLWGRNAEKKTVLINTGKHHVITSTHPSPLSASRGFFGSAPFSKINSILRQNGRKEIDWEIPELNDDFNDLPLFQ